MTRVRQVGERIEELLGRLRLPDGAAAGGLGAGGLGAGGLGGAGAGRAGGGRAGGGRAGGGAAAAAAEELVRLLVGLYGEGLEHIVAALRAAGPQGTAVLTGLTEDPLVESLLLLHDLHPLGVDARIQRALDRVRPYLGTHAGGVDYLGVRDGVARLRLEGTCHGCPSSTVTVKLAIEGAVLDAAPEVTEVVVEGMTETTGPEPVLLQIGPCPVAAPGEAGVAAGGISAPAGGVGAPAGGVGAPAGGVGASAGGAPAGAAAPS